MARLSLATRALHWSVALGVLGMLAYGFWLQTLPTGPGKAPYVQVHKSFGVIVFGLAVLRVLWRWREGFPPPAGAHRRWERHAARALHAFIILATVLMPVSGILRSLAYARPVDVFGLTVIPKLFAQKNDALYAISANLHDTLAFALALGIALHVGAALKHGLVDRDGTLSRMLGAPRSRGGL